MERCPECGSVYKMEYVGPPDDPHAHERTFLYLLSHINSLELATYWKRDWGGSKVELGC